MTPHTGKTHQLRVHLAAIGTPILGDGKYGGAGAFLLTLPNPATVAVGHTLIVKDEAGHLAANNVTLVPSAGGIDQGDASPVKSASECGVRYVLCHCQG